MVGLYKFARHANQEKPANPAESLAAQELLVSGKSEKPVLISISVLSHHRVALDGVGRKLSDTTFWLMERVGHADATFWSTAKIVAGINDNYLLISRTMFTPVECRWSFI